MFKNAAVQAQFSDQGYVVLSLLNEDVIQKIGALYAKTKDLSGLDNSFYTSIWSDNKAYKQQVDQELKDLLHPFLEKQIGSFTKVFANFMVKKAREDSALHPHQDWSFVDEEEFDSITIWMPLKDVTAKNGALEVLPKSNLLKNYKRARFQNSPFSPVVPFIAENLMKSIPLVKGEAIFVNSRTIHSSPPNLSGEDRIAVSIVVIPEKAALKHYVLDREDETAIFSLNIDTSFFVAYSCFDYPDTNNSSKEAVVAYNYGKEDILATVV